MYEAPTADGKKYIGRASKQASFGSIEGREVLEYRFRGGHHRNIDFSQARVLEEIWGGGTGSGAYEAIRGSEQLYYERAVQRAVATEQIAPISVDNPKLSRYLQAAQEMGVTPCP